MNKGFSLFEILLALGLSSIILGLVSYDNFSERNKLDGDVKYLEKAIRFSNDEAIIRNRVIRLHFDFDKTPQSYSLQSGPDSNFILPATITESDEDKVISVRDEDEKKAERKKFEGRFSNIPEFNDGPRELDEYVKLIAVGSNLNNELATIGTANIYVYPTGEKDGAIIFLGTSKEVVSIAISPFSSKIEKEYVTLDDVDEDEISNKQYDVAKVLFEKWLRN